MKALRKLWDSLHGLAAALDRLTGLAHQAADTVEERLPAPALDATMPERLNHVREKVRK